MKGYSAFPKAPALLEPHHQLAATPHKTPTVWPPAPITKTIQVRWTRHAGHCWRSRDKLIRDVLLWTPTHGRAKAGRPARTYIQQLCEDTECCPEDLPRAMNDGGEWRERVRDIRATSATWWWPVHMLFFFWWGGVLPLCREAVGVFYRPSQLGKELKEKGGKRKQANISYVNN